MKKLSIILILFCFHFAWAQNQEWHVKPYADNYTNPAGANGLSAATAWCLQYALNGGAGGIQVQPGDIIWLHGDPKATYTGSPSVNGVYKGHFRSIIAGAPGNYIKVSSYPGEWAVIDGNIHNGFTGSTWGAIAVTPPLPTGTSDVNILDVKGGNVRFENFEIACLGNFSRIKETRLVPGDPNHSICPIPTPPPFNFHEYVGIEHVVPNLASAIRNEFRNLVIRNIPGVAFGSWKFTLDTEIYGNIFYNNGVIEVTGTGCSPNLDQVVLTGGNTRGHQTCVYTQNATDVYRVIRNNVFIKCYDSAVNIWSANDDPSSLEYVKNYKVSKNVFINNGSPVRDETPNLLVSTDYNDIFNIYVESNVMYKNNVSGENSGILVNNSTNVHINNNSFFNGTTAAVFSGPNNHGINFDHNFYHGKRIQVLTSVANFQDSSNPWYMDYNEYYNKFMGYEYLYMYLAPNNTTSIPIETFRSTYNAEYNSTANLYPPTVTPANRYFIVQNKYNPNLFTVTFYNPNNPSGPFPVDFGSYIIPDARKFIAKDVQNYFTNLTIGTNVYNSSSHTINFPTTLTAFEPANPQPNGTSYGPSDITPIGHSNTDFNTFTVEFHCGLDYSRLVDRTDNSTMPDELAKNNISFGTVSGYTANSSTILNAKAGKQILIKNATIVSGAKFWAKIEDTCPDVPFNSTLDDAQFNMGAGLNKSAANNGTQEPKTNEKEYFAIFPNPNSGRFTVKAIESLLIKAVEINRTDNAGLVFSGSCHRQASVNIDISKESKGFYTVKVYFDDGSSQTKTVIKN